MKSFSSRPTSDRGVARQGGRRLYAPVAAARPRDRHTRASLGVVDLGAWPGPAAAHQHCGQALPFCNPASPFSHVIPLRVLQIMK